MSGRGYDVADWLRWAASAVLVLGAHAAAAAIIVTIADPVPAGLPAGAIMVDLAPISAASENAQPDVAPGPVQPQVDGPEVKPDQPIADKPDQPVVAEEPPEPKPQDKPFDVAVAKIEPVEEKAETPPELKPQDQPLIEKAPEAKKPDVVAAPPAAKPPPPKPKKASRPMRLATAPMPAPQVAPRATAPSQGMPSPSSSRSGEDWGDGINSALQRAKRYPSEARSRNEQGATKVAFVLDRAGRVLSSRIVTSSGFPALDQEALATVARASLPPAPAERTGTRFNFTVPIWFNIR